MQDLLVTWASPLNLHVAIPLDATPIVCIENRVRLSAEVGSTGSWYGLFNGWTSPSVDYVSTATVLGHHERLASNAAR